MHGRDANDATWYMLRYARDFTPRAPDLVADPAPPRLDPTLFYDDAREVLELMPRPPARETAPPPGLAVDPHGEVYRVDPQTGALLVRRCDGSEVPLVCEPRVLADPRGLALDRRGYLYVADARARRVVVLLPEDGSVRAVLDGALEEPVDVAVAPGGRVYVADRAGGRIAVYSARLARAGGFPARNAESLPAAPRPIAVMVEADGTVAVADANHPRLLRFTAAGQPLADVSLAPLPPALDIPLMPSEAAKAYGADAPRFLTGTCPVPGPCAPALFSRDAGARLADVHRALRLRALLLGRRFEPYGVFVSAALDSSVPGTTWHRIEVDADLPEGATLTVETWTSDDAKVIASGPERWESPPTSNGLPVPMGAPLSQQLAQVLSSVTQTDRLRPFGSPLQEQLVQSPPGRYLRVRVAFTSKGGATPSLRALKVLYPRVSYLDLLPQVYRRDPGSALFLERYLALFERMLTRVEDRYEEFSRQLNPDAVPAEIVDWLACLVDLVFDPSWSLERRRALLSEAMALYRARGTVRGLRRYVEIYTGEDPLIVEHFLQRPRQPAFLGREGSVLGCALPLLGPIAELPPDEQLIRDYAHRFAVVVYVPDRCDADVLLGVVDRIVEVNKPAHTLHTLCPIYPDARVGQQSTVGVDLVLGGTAAAGTRLGGRPEPGQFPIQAGVLGTDTVLGERRPMFIRARESAL